MKVPYSQGTTPLTSPLYSIREISDRQAGEVAA